MFDDLDRKDAANARAQERVDKQKVKVAAQRANREAKARKEIGETTLSALPAMNEKLRNEVVAALVPTLSTVALMLLVREGMLEAAKADAEVAARAEAKLAKKKPVGGGDAANGNPVTGA